MSSWMVIIAGISMVISAFVPDPIEEALMLIAYFFMFGAYLIKNRYND